MRKIFSLILLCSLSVFGQTVVSISALHTNNSVGVPADTTTLYKVKGVVTATNQLGNNATYGPGAIQDETAGITVYGSAFASGSSLAIGDTVWVTSRLAFYNGLTQLDMRKIAASSTVTKVASGTAPEPQVVTIYQILNQQWGGYEEFESRLIRINNVTFSSTGTFASGTTGKTYSITDGTNSLDFRLTSNAGNSINNLTIPTGKCDVIGIISQYRTSTPWSSGYQLMPRMISDIVTDATPLVYNNLVVNNIKTDAFTVNFQTVRAGNTQIKYGLTSALELDSVVIAGDTTNHIATISGLQPNTLYYFKAVSTNAAGTSESAIQQVTTASGSTKTGAINVYFNMPVDTSVAIAGNAAKGSVSFEEKLVNRVNNAVYSIDLAIYSMNGLSNLTTALLNAKSRGIKIRMVYDSRDGSATQANVQTLLNAGVLMSQRPASLSGIMHNKFFVFDARDTVSDNDWVWTGSWNPNSAEAGYKNNALEINDPTLASAYTKEFEEMWGSSTDTPNSTAAKFAYNKTNNTAHSFTIGGRAVRLYFSPSDGVTSQISSTIGTAQTSIYFAVMSFTKNDLGQAIYYRYSAGVKDIKGIINNINDTGSEYTYLQNYGSVVADAGATNSSVTLHDKYALIDCYTSNSDPTVITGSHNWSAAAETNNDENTLIITDFKIANQYMQDFKKRYNDAGGTGTFVIPTDVKDVQNLVKDYDAHLYQNYPNPFNPVTTIRFETKHSQNVKIEVYNALGQKVATLFDRNVTAGIYAVDFSSASLGNVSSGIYYYRLTAGVYSDVKKMILMK
jgi:phosphatidylserine/phosphatidylglycerophosphate/cardiolipin synthase-like enzyme